MPDEFQGGETFTTTAPGKTVTAARLNNHVAGALLLRGAIENKTEITATAENDTVAVADTSDGSATEPKKVQLVNLQPESVRNGSKLYGTAVLTGSVYAVTLSPAATVLTAGMRVVVLPNATNAGAVQLQVNGLTATNIYKGGGSGPVALEAGDIVAGVACEMLYDGTQFQLLSGISLANQVSSISGQAASLAAIRDSARNLVVQPPTTSTVSATADECLLETTAFLPYVARGVSVTADITASGANGLDTGVEASSTWYYLWLIYNPNSATVAALLSLSATSPTMPSGYTYKALLGAVRNNGSSNFVTFYQQGRMVFVADAVLFTAKTSAAANTYESYSGGAGGGDVDLATVVPPIAKRLRGNLGCTPDLNASVAIAGDSTGLGAMVFAAQSNSAGIDGMYAGGMFDIPLITAQTFYWKSQNNSDARNRVNVNGYVI